MSRPFPKRPTRRVTRSAGAMPLGRREFLIRSGMLGGATLMGPTLLAACGSDDKSSTSSGGGGGGDNSLNFSNWPAYIDEESAGIFGEESGIKFKYVEDFNDNNEYFAKIQPDLSAGRTIDADLIAPTYWLTARLIQLDFLDEMPSSANVDANLVDELRNPAWDPDQKYSVPWQSGMTGIAYNASATGRELKSIEDIFDPAFKGKIGMLTEMRDTVGLVMLSTGKDPANATFDDAAAAFDRIEKAKNDGQIRQFTGNDYMDDLAAENFVACIGWSGDIGQLALDNPDLKFVIPEEGGMQWSDTMVVPKGAKHRDQITKWLDFVYDPVNAARIAAFVGYNSPVKGVREELEKDPETAALGESKLLFPDEATLAQLKVFASLDEEEEAKFDERFSSIIGA